MSCTTSTVPRHSPKFGDADNSNLHLDVDRAAIIGYKSG